MDERTDRIDIARIARERMGAKAKWVPDSFFSALRGFIHEDFINRYLEQGRTGVDFCRGVLDYLGVTVDVKGRENLPDATGGETRRLTFASNHPLGAIDGVTLGAVLGEHYQGRVKYLVNDLLMNLRGLAPLCVPVNKIGAQGRGLPRMVDEAFAGQDQMIVFPAGLCSRRGSDGKVRDLPWGKAFVVKSVEHRRDVVPVHFVGENSGRFYSVAAWCKRLRLPNLAMALLPDEMYRSRGRHYEVRIGKPIAWQTFDKTRTAREWAKYVEDIVYET